MNEVLFVLGFYITVYSQELWKEGVIYETLIDEATLQLSATAKIPLKVFV